MITVELSATALAATRFGLSPLMEIGTVLNQWHPQARRGARWAHAARDTVVRHDLRLLAGFLGQHRGYVPDFLNPLPAGYDADVDRELHEVATTPPEQVAAELAAWVRGKRGTGPQSARHARPVLECLHHGEEVFAQRLADELALFWAHFLAPRWPTVHRRLEADVDRRAKAAARDGLGALLGGLDRTTRWHDGALHVTRPFHRTVRETTGLLLLPSTLAGHVGVGIDPLGVRPVHLVYPATATPSTRHLGDVLGHTRTALLQDLDVPRTTAELARRHHLAPSTVSYHLGRLHRAGMVQRTRTANTVRYHRR
ncbi:helix-turn-helix domain-containing protein [Actinosynnema sp. CS-041913]|uniref:helix-turn-helix domain-containing protein n=1 Tax=Actinosynnema sp. CS-041913 TaxID=3239917 RepID=UPI003D8FC9FC